MAIAVSDYADGLALPPADRPAAAAVIRRLAADLATDGLEAVVTFDLDWLAEIFAGWNARLPATANPRFWPRASHPDASIVVLLRRDGKTVGASAQRMVWLRGSLRRALESGRFFYGAAAAPTGWRCECNIAQAEAIADCPVIYNCAYRMELPGAAQRISWRALRLSQALAAVHWPWSWMVARSDEAMAMRFSPMAAGITSIAKGLFVYPPGAREPEPWQHMLFARRGDIEQQILGAAGYAAGEGLSSPLPLEEAAHVAGS